MIEGDSLGSSLGAILTGVAVTSGPWLMTTAVLVLMRVSAVAAGITDVTAPERVITIVYAVAIVVSAPIDIVITRYSADRVYERNREHIAPPLRRTLAICLVVFTGVGALAMRLFETPAELAVPGTVLAAIVGGQWLLLSAAGGLSSPGIILRAFAVGAPVSVLAWHGLSRLEVFGTAGYLYGFGAGQLLTLAMLLWGTFRALPEREVEGVSLMSAARTYWLLALAAFAFNAGLWVDKLVVLLLGGARAASEYGALAAVAWLSVVPACAYLFVVVETVFHRRFHAFYGALYTGATLAELEQRAGEVRHEVGRTLAGTAAVQAGVSLVCLMLAPSVTRALGFQPAAATTISWLFVGAGLQVVAVAATLLLYYFDFRTEALAAAVTQLATNALLTTYVGVPSAALGLGYAAACAVTSIVAVALLRARMPALLQRTFQVQPYAFEG